MGKWFVMREWNDDNDPYMMFDDLAAVRKQFYRKRLTKVDNDHYTFKNDSGVTLHVHTIKSLDAYFDEGALGQLQLYGYVDEQQRYAQYFDLIDVWHPMSIGDLEKRSPLIKLLLSKGPEGVLNEDKFGPFKKHLKHHEAVFAVKKPKSLEELPQ